MECYCSGHGSLIVFETDETDITNQPLIKCSIYEFEYKINMNKHEEFLYKYINNNSSLDIDLYKPYLKQQSEFDFTFSTNDTYIDIFKPYIELLCNMFYFKYDKKLKEILNEMNFNLRTKGKFISSTGNKMKNDELCEYILIDLERIKKIIKSKIIIHGPDPWATLLEKTILNVIMLYYTPDILKPKLKKCPHFDRNPKIRRKN